MPSRIDRFAGAHAFLSNFAPSPVELDGVDYPTVEHAFQAAKTFDEAARARIAAAASPVRAKQLGRRVPLRPDWDVIRPAVMHELVRRKFRRHPELAAQLLATGDALLVEGNTWGDRYWGVAGGDGQNWLGRLLELVRAELLLERP